MIQHEQKGSQAWKRGIRGYASNVRPCRACHKPCNTTWKPSSSEKAIFACCQECADIIDTKENKELCGFCGQDNSVSHTKCLQILSTPEPLTKET